MSVECGICEHDLRGGHAGNCPRNPHIKELVQRWNDAQVAAADAELLHRGPDTAQAQREIGQAIERELSELGLNIKELVCP